ncbi:type II toxin-antitoxin system RelE/ParE family toxin [Lamprobacter modestohalophilus]|uniref:Type II toxin-antitoxin system RelE/ParE family toxin n=1 Tax=Lamprobacter modestohalophilus TaxID=1064514 RepID=A0A9X0W6Y2_9GAMM|nr:type II toxin-antitoxin system RelE/ParE family toxin [Lamprobacter modestohalophilus]MBK1617961.1 hypothetical protein [Lamprobacter modestohalophilus]MEA1049201.1 type II toxin-antitoxin system RelE/ParE family toxin [Lamprobacter modestohalophilus]
MQRVFKTRLFCRWMRKTALTDEMLCLAVQEMQKGLIDADLGAGVLKKRVAVAGHGKRGGSRTLVATNKDTRWLFLFGFEKKARANIRADEKEALQALAQDWLARSNAELDQALATGALEEICREH